MADKTKGLSDLQKRILTMAEKQGGAILARDVLVEVYGFEYARFPPWVGAVAFDRRAIGKRAYNAATVATCRAFNRLAARGLAERIPSGVRLPGEPRPAGTGSK